METTPAPPSPRCPFCGGAGGILYAAKRDVMKPTPGAWDLMRCRARGCGAIWLDPMPDEAVLRRAYTDYYTHNEAPSAAVGKGFGKIVSDLVSRSRQAYLRKRYGYASPLTKAGSGGLLAIAGRLSSRKRAEWDAAVMFLPAHAGGKLLDVGCGSGKFLAFMRDWGWDVRGCDYDEGAVAMARSRLLDVRVGGIEALRYEEGYFDAVTLSHVIEHVPDPRQTLHECRRILKRNGVLVMTSPNTASLAHRFFKSNWMHLDTPRHLHLFHVRLLTALTKECGFAQVRGFSTVLGADLQYYFSRMIARSGRNSMVVPAARKLILPRLFSSVESLWLKCSPASGEDLVVIARK